MSLEVKKLAVFRLGAMGDLLHLAPSLREVRACHPKTEIHLITSPGYRDFTGLFEGVSQVWGFEKGKNWLETGKNLKQLSENLKETGIDGFINLQPNLKTWLLARIILGTESGERTAIYRKEKISAPALQKRTMPRRHAVEDFYRTFQALLDLPDKTAEALIPQLPPRFPGGKDPLDRQNPMPIGLIPGVGGKRANRAWPLENYTALARRLAEARPGLHFILIGGPEEAVLSERLMQMKDPLVPMINHCGKHSLVDTADLMTRCRFIVGGDTGPLHLAAAVGTPLIALYGPTALSRTGPLGHQPILRLTPPESDPGWPCEEPSCQSHGGGACIDGITVDDVFGACLQMLEMPPENVKTPVGESEPGFSQKTSPKKRKR